MSKAMSLTEFFLGKVKVRTKKHNRIINGGLSSDTLVQYLSTFWGRVPNESNQLMLMKLKENSIPLRLRGAKEDPLAKKKPGKYTDLLKQRRRFKVRAKPRQQLIFRKLSKKAQEAYLSSFFESKRNVNPSIDGVFSARLDLKSNGTDKLKEKRKDSVLIYSRNLKNASRDKKPIDIHLGQWIGVEIECFLPREDIDGVDDLASRMTQEGLRYVTVKTDASIRPDSGYFGAELTVFFRRSNPEPLKSLCRFLNNHGAKVNDSCGLHVHLDCRDIIDNKTALSKRIDRFKNSVGQLARLVPESRRSNQYCRIGVSTRNGDRYFAVNTTALRKYQTIEVRLHSGTTAYTKIINWSELLFSISRAQDLTNEEAGSVDDLLSLAGASDSLTEYFLARAKSFETAPVPVVRHESEDGSDSDYVCVDCSEQTSGDFSYRDDIHCELCYDSHVSEEAVS
jgi:hypothetical protein